MKKIVQVVPVDTSSIKQAGSDLGRAVLENMTAKIQLAEDIYHQVHDFTATGAARFAGFIAEHSGQSLSAEACRMACLGVIEDNLNSTMGGPLSWELNAASSSDGKAHTFTAEFDDLIIETVTPEGEAPTVAAISQDFKKE
ncbi:hypothetical protein WDX82_005119 [Salmonella enterica]